MISHIEKKWLRRYPGARLVARSANFALNNAIAAVLASDPMVTVPRTRALRILFPTAVQLTALRIGDPEGFTTFVKTADPGMSGGKNDVTPRNIMANWCVATRSLGVSGSSMLVRSNLSRLGHPSTFPSGDGAVRLEINKVAQRIARFTRGGQGPSHKAIDYTSIGDEGMMPLFVSPRSRDSDLADTTEENLFLGLATYDSPKEVTDVAIDDSALDAQFYPTNTWNAATTLNFLLHIAQALPALALFDHAKLGLESKDALKMEEGENVRVLRCMFLAQALSLPTVLLRLRVSLWRLLDVPAVAMSLSRYVNPNELAFIYEQRKALESLPVPKWMTGVDGVFATSTQDGQRGPATTTPLVPELLLSVLESAPNAPAAVRSALRPAATPEERAHVLGDLASAPMVNSPLAELEFGQYVSAGLMPAFAWAIKLQAAVYRMLKPDTTNLLRDMYESVARTCGWTAWSNTPAYPNSPISYVGSTNILASDVPGVPIWHGYGRTQAVSALINPTPELWVDTSTVQPGTKLPAGQRGVNLGSNSTIALVPRDQRSRVDRALSATIDPTLCMMLADTVDRHALGRTTGTAIFANTLTEWAAAMGVPEPDLRGYVLSNPAKWTVFADTDGSGEKATVAFRKGYVISGPAIASAMSCAWLAVEPRHIRLEAIVDGGSLRIVNVYSDEQYIVTPGTPAMTKSSEATLSAWQKAAGLEVQA